MELPRPTIKALKMLPRESFADFQVAQTLKTIANTADREEKLRLLKGLRLAAVKQPLISIARAIYAKGQRPERHASASQAAGQTVYEIEEPASGWRAAVTTDDAAAPWLVYAKSHDHFHADVSSFFKQGHWSPTALDHDLKAHEAKHHEYQVWRASLMATIFSGLRSACDDAHASVATPTDLRGRTTTLGFEVTLDQGSSLPEEAHHNEGLVEVAFFLTGASDPLGQEILRCLRVVQPDCTQWDQAYLLDGRMQISLILTLARLVQLVSDVPVTSDAPPDSAPPPTHLHYVESASHAAGVVHGTAVRGLCGIWFVPQLEKGAHLPICDECESTEPIARRFLDSLKPPPVEG